MAGFLKNYDMASVFPYTFHRLMAAWLLYSMDYESLPPPLTNLLCYVVPISYLLIVFQWKLLHKDLFVLVPINFSS